MTIQDTICLKEIASSIFKKRAKGDEDINTSRNSNNKRYDRRV